MSLAEPAHHDDLLNYQLKRLVALGGAPAIRLCEGRFGVTRRQWRLVAAVVEHGPASPSALAGHAQVSRAITSKTLAELVTKGLLQRADQPGDRRRAQVEVTEAGRRLYDELFPQLAAINRRLVAALDADEAAVLERALGKLTERARQIHAEGGGVDEHADRRHGGSRLRWAARDSEAG